MKTSLDTFYELGTKAELSFQLFKPGKIDFHEEYEITPIEISVAGSYAGLRGYIQEIKQLQGLVILDNLSIQTKVDDVLEMRARVNIYRANSK